MAVIRVNKNKDYTIMSNTHLQDKEMSLKAKGLLSVMLSLPNSWDYSINGLVAILKENKTAVQSTLKELEELNYLRRTKIKDEKGQFDYIYDIYEKPFADNPQQEKPRTENLCTGVLCTENVPQLNTNKEITKKENTNKLITNNKEPKHAFGEYGRVKLTNSEYNKLVADYGEDKVNEQIELLDEYVESNNNKNKYSNFNLVLRKSIRENWFNKNEVKNNGNNKRNIKHAEFNEFPTER